MCLLFSAASEGEKGLGSQKLGPFVTMSRICVPNYSTCISSYTGIFGGHLAPVPNSGPLCNAVSALDGLHRSVGTENFADNFMHHSLAAFNQPRLNHWFT